MGPPAEGGGPVTGPAGRLRDDLAGLEGYHSPQVPVSVRLNTNESPYPPPAAWRDAFLEELAAVPFNRYPDRSARALREAIADLHGVEPEQVLVGKGSNEVIQTVCLAFGGPGRSALVFEPTYALHSHIARLTGTEVVAGERSADFTVEAEPALEVLGSAQPTIAFLCSPNNPTGTLDDPVLVEKVVSAAPGLVLVDEAYAQFAPWSALSLVAAGAGNLVVTRTYSKTWSMAAARIGYLMGPAPIVAALERVVLPYHLDAATQIAGRLALRFREEMEARVTAVVRERERMAAALAALGVSQWPSAANFILFRPAGPDPEAGRRVWQGLVERSVLVRDWSGWPRLEGCLRVTVGTPEENDAFLDALKEVLE